MLESLVGKEGKSNPNVATGIFVPRSNKPVSNKDLAQHGLNTHRGKPIDESFIFSRTRITQRFHTQDISHWPEDPEQMVPLMGYSALDKALKRKGWQIDDLDFLLATTSFPLTIPTSEAIYSLFKFPTKEVKPTLNLTLMDCYAACSGFAYWFCEINQNREAFTGKKIGIVATEQYSVHVEGFDKAIFGDGAGAFLFTLDEDLAILGTAYKYFGDPNQYLRMHVGPAPQGKYSSVAFYVPIPPPEKGDFEMNGNPVYKFIIGEDNLDVAIRAIKDAKVDFDGLQIIAVHQANGNGIEKIAEKVQKHGFKGKIPSNISKYGNTSSASVPILLDEVLTEGQVKPGDQVLIWGMGAGLFSAASVIRFL